MRVILDTNILLRRFSYELNFFKMLRARNSLMSR